MSNNKIEKSYFEDLIKIKETIKENRYKALVVVNGAMIVTYYKIGTIIKERKEWGNKYIQRLAEDLKEYGRGYSYSQLVRMLHFAENFSYEETVAPPAQVISWTTLSIIIEKSSSKEEMLWHVNQTYKNRWSRRMIVECFKNKVYERKLIEPQVTEIVEKDEGNRVVKK